MTKYATEWLVKTDSALITLWPPLTILSRRPLGFVSPRFRADNMFRVLERIHIEMFPSVSVPSLSQPGPSVLSRPLWPPQAQGCPLHMPEGKNGLTAVSASCNTVWLNIYSAAAGLRLWMDDMSNTDTSLWNSIFIFIALAGPGVCVFPPRSSFINTFKRLQLQLKTHLDSCSYSSVFVLILFSF